MIEQFEEKKFLEYVLNFVNYKKKNQGKNYFSKSSSHYIYLLNDVELSLWTDKQELKNGEEFLNKLNELIEKYSSVVISSKTEQKINQVARIYGITPAETEILGYIVRNNLYDDVYDSFSSIYSNTTSIPYLQLKNGEMKRALKGLTLKGLVNDCNSALPIMEVFFDDRDFSDKEICEIVFGKALNTNLDKKDFKHLKQELSICTKIVKNAVKNNTRGVNILFYGAHGSGKTEMSYLIGKLSGYTLNEVEYVDSEGEYMNFRERIGSLLAKLQIIEHSGKRFILFDEADY